MKQKLLTGLIVVFAFLAAFLSGYILSGNGTPSKEADNSNAGTGNILDKFVVKSDIFENIPPRKTPILLSKNKVASFTLLNTGSDALYYEKGTGRVFNIELNTNEEKNVSKNNLTNFIETIWSPDKQEVISQFYIPSGTQYKYYNLQTKKSATLNSLQRPAFSPDGSHIASFSKAPDSEDVYNIIVSEPDGDISKKIFSTRMSSVALYWPQENLLAFKTDGNYNRSTLFSLSKNGTISEILKESQNLQIKWSLSGHYLLFSKTGDNGQQELFYKNITDGSEIVLPISTSASKCAWSIDDKIIVCAEPTTGSEENLFLLDIVANTKQLISPLGQDISLQEIQLSNINDYAIFLNSYDERLYSLKLK